MSKNDGQRDKDTTFFLNHLSGIENDDKSDVLDEGSDQEYWIRYEISGEIYGPLSIETVLIAAKSGKVSAGDEIAKSQKGPWQKVDSADGPEYQKLNSHFAFAYFDSAKSQSAKKSIESTETKSNVMLAIETYPLLEFHYRVLRILGVLSVVLAGTIFLTGLIIGVVDTTLSLLIWFIVCTITGVIFWFLSWLSAESLRAFINITIDIRMIRIQTSSQD